MKAPNGNHCTVSTFIIIDRTAVGRLQMKIIAVSTFCIIIFKISVGKLQMEIIAQSLCLA